MVPNATSVRTSASFTLMSTAGASGDACRTRTQALPASGVSVESTATTAVSLAASAAATGAAMASARAAAALRLAKRVSRELRNIWWALLRPVAVRTSDRRDCSGSPTISRHPGIRIGAPFDQGVWSRRRAEAPGRSTCGRGGASRRLVRPPDIPADGARLHARHGIELEEARAAVRPAVGAGGRRSGSGAAAKPAHVARTAGVGRGRGSGHHGCWYSLAFWRAIGVGAVAASWLSPLRTARGRGRSGLVARAAYRERPFGGGARPLPSRRTGYPTTIPSERAFVNRYHDGTFGCTGTDRAARAGYRADRGRRAASERTGERCLSGANEGLRWRLSRCR